MYYFAIVVENLATKISHKMHKRESLYDTKTSI